MPQKEDKYSGMACTRALGEWLNNFAWSHWATFTFRVGCPEDCLIEHSHEGGWGLLGPSPSGASGHLHRFLDVLPRAPGYFYCVERGPWGGRCHGHALLKTRRAAMENTGKGIDLAWGKRFGRCQLRPYDAERGAAYYCGKYITKGPLLWDLGGPIVGR